MEDPLEVLLQRMLEMSETNMASFQVPTWSPFESKPTEGGEQSPPTIVEIGDAPDLTRLMNPPAVEGAQTVVASWSSLEVFAKQFKGDPGTGWWAKHNVRNDWSEHFNGAESFNAALDLAIHGWAEGGVTIERTRGYIKALNPLSPRITKYGIAGTTPNVPRAIAGNILNMRQPEVGRSRKRQVITIVYNMCENGCCDKDSITNKAAVTAALIDEIEAKGFACEVVAAVVSRGAGWPAKIWAYEFVRIKESHLPIDINRLAFGLGHASMFRGLFFADMQRNREFEAIGSGLGSAQSTKPTKELQEQQIYTITSADGSSELFETVDKAVTVGLNRIVSELQKQGCPAFEKKDHEDDLEKPTEEEPEDFSSYDPEW